MAYILHGTGMCMMMVCMLIFSRRLQIRCGGTGAGTGALQVQDGDLAGDGRLHGIIAVGILPIGTVATGGAIGEATGAVTGDRAGIIIIRTGQAIIV